MDFEQFLEIQDQNAENVAEVIQNYIKKTTKAGRGLRFPDEYNFNTTQTQAKFLSMFLEQFTGRFQDMNQQINTEGWLAYERQGLKKILKLSFQYQNRNTREQDQLLNDREFINKFQNRNAANLLIVTKPIQILEGDPGNLEPIISTAEAELTWAGMRDAINQSQLPQNQQRKTRAQKNLYENEFIQLQNEMCQTIANTIYKNKFFQEGVLQRQIYQLYQQGQAGILDVWHNYLIMNDLQTVPQRFPEYEGQDDENYRTLPRNFGKEGSAVNTSGELYQQLFYNSDLLKNQQRFFFENMNIMQTMLLGLMEQTQFAKQAHFYFHGGSFNYNFARDTNYEQKLTFLINNTDPVNTSLLQHFNFPGENEQKVISFPSILWQQNLSPMFFTTVYMFIQWLMSKVMLAETFDFNEVAVLSFYSHIYRTKFVHGANITNQQQYDYKYGSYQGFQFVTTLKICNHIWWLMNRDNTYTKMGFTIYLENNIEQLTHRTDEQNDQLDQPFDGDLMKLQFERAQFQLKVLDSHFGLRFSNISIYNLDATISQMIVDSYNNRTMYRERIGVSIEFTERLKRKIREKIDWIKKKDEYNSLNPRDKQEYKENVEFIRKNIETVIRNQYTQKIIEEGDRDKLQTALQRIIISSVKEFIDQRNLLKNQLFTGGRVSFGVFYNILYKVQMREGPQHEVQNWLTARGYVYKLRSDQEGFDEESFRQNFDLLQDINRKTHKESKMDQHSFEFFPERVFFNPKGYLNSEGERVEYREAFQGQQQYFHRFVKKQVLFKIKQSFLLNEEQQQDFCDQLFIQIILQIFESAFYQESGFQELTENTEFFNDFSLQNIKLQRIQLIYFPIAGVDGTNLKENERLLDAFQKVQLKNMQEQQEQQQQQQQLEKEIDQIFESDQQEEIKEEEKMVNIQDEIRLLEQQLQQKQQREQQIYQEIDDELEKDFNQPISPPPQQQQQQYEDVLEKDFYEPIKQKKQKREIKQKAAPQKRKMPTILSKADIQLQKKQVIPEKVMNKVEIWRRRFWSHIDLDGLPELAQTIEEWYRVRGADQSIDILSNMEYEQMLQNLIDKYVKITNETIGNYAVDVSVQQLFDRIYRNPLWSEIRKNPFMGILSQIYKQKIQLWSEIRFFSQLDCKFQLYNCLCKVWFYIFYISHSIRFYFFQNTWNENFKNLFSDFQNAKELFKDLRNFQLFNRVIMMTTIQQNHKNKIFQQFCESLALGQLTKSFQFFFDFIISQKINPEEFKKPQNTINIIQIIDFSHLNKPEFILKQQIEIRLKELQNIGFNVSTRTETMIRIGVYDFHVFIANAKQFSKLLIKITSQDNKSQQQQLLQQQLEKKDHEKQIKQQQYRYPLFLNSNRKLQQKINFNKLQQIDTQNLQQECLSKFELFKYNNIIKKFSEENDFKLLQQYSSVIAFDFETTSMVSNKQNINLMNPYAFALYGNIHLFGFDKNQPPHKQLVEIYPNTPVSQIIDIDMDLLNEDQIEILFQQRFIQRKFVKYIFKLNEEIDEKINEYNEKYLITKEKKEKYNSGDNREKKQSVQLVNNVKFVGFNSAKFDLHLVINEIIRLYQGFNIQNNLRFVGDKNSIKRLQVGHIIFEDCYPLMQGSLKMWSISFNPDDKQYQKDQSVQIKNLQTVQQIRQNYKEIKQYNLQDAKSTYSVYLNFIKLVNNLVKRLYDQQKVPEMSRFYYSPDNIPLTIASLAIQTINKVYQYSAIRQNIFAKGISENNLKMEPEIYTACRKSYYGGIVLPFSIKRYNTDFYGLDVNSLYPYIMKHNCRNFAVSFSYSKIQRLDIQRNDYMYKNILQFLKPHYLYKVEGFQFQKGKLVTLPTRIEKELIYVEKCFEVESYRWGCEIIFAIQKDLLERIIITKTFIFEQKPLDFIGQYVETLYNERVKSKKDFAIQQLERKVKIIEKERNKKKLTEQQIQQKVDRKLDQIKNVYEMILKLYLNSSYGKLAQKEFDQFQFIDHKQLEEMLFKTGTQSAQQLEDQLDQYIKEITPFEDDDQNQNQHVGFQDPVSTIFRVRMSNKKLNLNNNIGTLAFIASQITALARIHLQGLIITAGGPESKDIYYSDTDSIYCSSRAYLKLLKAGQVDPNQLGKLKVELDSSKYQFKQFQAFGQKVYDIQLQKDNNQRLENKCAFKGVMGKMRDIIISQFRFQGYYDPNLQKEFDEDFKSVQIKWKKLQSQGIIRMEQMLGIINLKPKLQYDEEGQYVKFVSDLNEYFQVYKNLIIKLLQNDKFEYVFNLPQQQ